ncbi:MAG TPA: zinc ribbon domain-containing protein [Ktedonobacterales bacterium]|nr:zinc ribbon domain-containing protein [Ktedonobacterales bacterium]
MANQPGGLICAQCGWANAPGARYCASCGEVVDPTLAAELQRLYTVLTELEAQVAAGRGGDTVQSLRDGTRERYLAQRTAPPTMAGVPAPVTTPLPQTAAPVGAAPGAAPGTARGMTQAAPTVAASAAAMSTPAAPAQPRGPVFSWRAFIAEQAIAVMAYLGGFLLLIATLTFEVGGWQALPDIAKLAGVLAVYVLFGLLGTALRRATSLRTVGRVYLGVFALMTPLAALAVYRFELQARGFPIPGMVCISAAYAAVVYVSLAARTRFVTYAYLGWASLLVGALAIPPWANLLTAWWIPVLNLVGLALLAPHALARRRNAPDWLGILESTALYVSEWAFVVGAIMTIIFTVLVAGHAFGSTNEDSARAGLAVATCALLALTIAWSWAARTIPALGEFVPLIDWFISALVSLAALTVGHWLYMTAAGYAYMLACVALVEGLAAEALRARAPRRLSVRIGVQIVAAGTVAIGMFIAASTIVFGLNPASANSHSNAPLLTAGAVAITLGLLFALRGARLEVFWWGLFAGVFTLIEAQITFTTVFTASQLNATSDQSAAVLIEGSTLHGALTLALVALGLCLHLAPSDSRLRYLRAPVEATALMSAIITAIVLGGHTRIYSVAFLSAFALAALLVARIERQPFLAGAWVTIFGVAASLVFIIGNPDSVMVAAAPVALALATLALGRALGRGYSISVYIVTLVATGAAFVALITSVREPADRILQSHPGLGGWMAIIIALILTVDALPTRAPLWRLAPASVALLSVVDARALWPAVALTLAIAGTGALLRRIRGAYWETTWHAAAAVGSLIALYWALRETQSAAALTLGVSLLFALVAYLIAWQSRLPWLGAAMTPYVIVALWQAGDLPLTETQRLIVTGAIALALTLAGMAARLRLGRAWALAPYAVALIAVYFTAARVTPYPERAGLLEAILLVFAALAFVAALLEETPVAALAPAVLASAAALAQPDGRALLPLALVFAALAFAVSRWRGAGWALPLYGAAMVAAVASAWQGRAQAGVFEVVALATLALAAWALGALESRADALLVAFSFAALAVSAGARAFGWETWQTTLAFAALAWIFELSREGWARIPWLRERNGAWLVGLGALADAQAAWRDPRRAGQRVGRGAAALTAVCVVIGGWLAPQSFATQTPQTQAMAVGLLSLAALLTRFGWGSDGWRPALYLAGEALALSVSWELRWLGAANLQAWIIAPGSAQLIIGALLPADTRLRPPAWAAQVFSIAGALVLTLPTLGQSITEPVDWQWRYALLLAVEALALTLLAVGLRNRILALTGSAFVGVAAIRGAIIAVQQNLPVPIVIGIFALALMGLATWLSLRARRAAHTHTAP